MNCRRNPVWLTLLCGILCTAGVVRPARGADQPEAKPADARSVREQTIYIPYDKLRTVFEQHGRGVFLPYEKFQELWQAARAQTAAPAVVKPPVGALVTEIENEAQAGKDVVHVKALLKIDVLAEGWSEIPLRLADSAIVSAVLDDDPARIIGSPEQGYKLLVFKKDQTPQRMQLRLEYVKAISKAPGQNSVQFEAPQVAVSRWKVRIPEGGVKVNIRPLLAATEAPAETPAQPAQETVVLAFVGAAAAVRIEWTPKAEGASGMEALASVQAEQQVWLSEGVARTKVRLSYAISRAELSQLTLEVPADQKITNVFDANVRQWSVQTAGKVQKVSVQLFEPAKNSQEVVVELEKFSGDQATSSFSTPLVKALGVGRQQGLVVVDVDPSLRAEAVRAGGLLQVDRSDLPAALTGGRWAFSYRYAALPFELALSLEKVQPRVTADALIEAYLEPERLSLDMSVVFTIEQAGVFRLELEMPQGYEVQRVVGSDRGGATPAQVDTHHLEGPRKQRLVVNLARKGLGKVGLLVELRKELHEPALTVPGEKSAELQLTLPQTPTGSVENSAGRLLVYAPESLRVNPHKTTGLRAIGFKEALESIGSARSVLPGNCRPVLAFAYGQDPLDVSLDAQRRKPQVTVDQLLQVRVEDVVVKYQCTLFYHVRYSGVKALRIDVPQALAAKLRNTTRAIREKELQPPPADVPPNYVAWSLIGEAELLGDGRIDLAWDDEQSVGKLEVGKSVSFAIPRLIPRDLDRAWGQIVLAKSETIAIQEAETSQGLRPIDPQHDLMPGAAVSGAARAFEFQDDWNLGVVATRYRLEEVKRTSIERGVVQVVLTSANQIAVRARYRLRSARQRLEVQLPEPVTFDTQPVRIDGRPIVLERGQGGRFFIPLLDRGPDQSLLLELRYTQPDHPGRRLELPSFAQEAAMQKVYLCVYLPERLVLLAKRGPWTDEFTWRMDGYLNWRPVPNTSEAGLNDWLGVSSKDAATGDAFQTDRQLYLFSTLQPPAPPEGALHMTLLADDRLTQLILGALGLLGLLLLWAKAATRVLFVGLVIIAAVLLGLFWPIAAHQLLGGRLVAVLSLLLVLWVIAAAYRAARAKVAGTICKPTPAPPLRQPLPPADTGVDLSAQLVTPPAAGSVAPSTATEGDAAHD